MGPPRAFSTMPPIQYILFDLDDTLYNPALHLFGEIGVRIESWLARTLGLTTEEARNLRREYYLAYGTTLMGLQRHHPGVDLEDYLAAVHDVPNVADYLTPDPALAAMLARLAIPKIIFTNAIVEWAEKILNQLAVRDQFAAIVDVRETGYVSKPWPAAYEAVLARLGVSGPACILVDDQPRNLQGGAAFGMRTVLVRPDGVPGDGVEFAAPDILTAEPLLQALLRDHDPV